MRIALSGSHRTGKSTLLGDLAEQFPGYATVPEPYEILEEEGYEFAHPPSLEDYLRQLERSIDLLGEHGEDALFDRCPLDFVAYALSCADGATFEAEEHLDVIRPAVATLSLVVLVPVEEPDRIALPASEDDGLRSAVDEKMREILVDDAFGLDLEVLEVSGNRAHRAGMVLRWMRSTRAASRR
jgi:predicted ATPase